MESTFGAVVVFRGSQEQASTILARMVDDKVIEPTTLHAFDAVTDWPVWYLS